MHVILVHNYGKCNCRGSYIVTEGRAPGGTQSEFLLQKLAIQLGGVMSSSPPLPLTVSNAKSSYNCALYYYECSIVCC